MNKFTFHELVIGIIVGDVKDGAEFETSSGLKAIYKYGSLTWVTQSGYIGSPVVVNIESINETFTLKTKVVDKELSFTEAMQYLAEGDTVFATIEGRGYQLHDLEDVDSLIENKEYFGDVYKARYTVPVEETVEDLPFSDEPEEAEPSKTRQGIKITSSEAWDILHQYNFAKKSVNQIADTYGISPRMVYYILDGTHWAVVYEDFHTEFDVVTEDYIK